MYIYALVCPKTNQVRYVGKTDKPKTRLSAHISTSKRMKVKSPLALWIVGLLSEGLRPTLTVLRELTGGNYRFWEAFHYQEYANSGLLLNAQPLSSIKHSEYAVDILIKACKASGFTKKELATKIGANYGDTCSFLKGYSGMLSAKKIDRLWQFIDELRPQIASLSPDSFE